MPTRSPSVLAALALLFVRLAAGAPLEGAFFAAAACGIAVYAVLRGARALADRILAVPATLPDAHA